MMDGSNGAHDHLNLDVQAELEAVAAVIGEENCYWEPRRQQDREDVDDDEEDGEEDGDSAEFKIFIYPSLHKDSLYLAGTGRSIVALPPFELSCRFPHGYPTCELPLLSLTTMWLPMSDLRMLCERLAELGASLIGEPVLLVWIDFLREDALEFLGVHSEYDPFGKFEDALHSIAAEDNLKERGGAHHVSALNWNVPWAPQDATLVFQALMRFNEEQELAQFQKGFQTCGICFEEDLGSNFVRLLPCKHHYCLQCVRQMLELHCKEGSLGQIKCPQTGCGHSLDPQLIQSIVDPEIYERWERLTLQRSLDAMQDVVYCPECQTPCLEDAKDRFAICSRETCSMSGGFCTQCLDSYHPGRQCLNPEARLELLSKAPGYGATPDEIKKKRLALENERKSMEYLQSNTKSCPVCSMAIERSMGCNKMKCTQCSSYFCYKCGEQISGYEHFREGQCVLFDSEEIRLWEDAMQEMVMEQNVQMMRAFGMDGIPGDAYFLNDQDPLAAIRNHHRNLGGGRARRRRIAVDGLHGRRCPVCRQLSAKTGNDNHIRCFFCGHGFCYLCGERVNKLKDHYAPSSKSGTSSNRRCVQHS